MLFRLEALRGLEREEITLEDERRENGGASSSVFKKKGASMRAKRAEASQYEINRAVGARARCAFTRALNAVNALSGTTSLLSPSASDVSFFSSM